ncbi:MAG: cell division protein [Herbaspirillum sp.]|jgi:cell division protein FtsN|nr:cell division protein [Herbaspirillum sp.]
MKITRTRTGIFNRRQQGGTFLGIIVGLVVGLAIAVGVALMITKSPIPFTNRAIRPERAPDPLADQVADPNKLLYGSKEVARQTARDQAKADANAAPGTAAVTGAAPGTPGGTPIAPVAPTVPLSAKASADNSTAEPKNQVSSASAAVSKADDEKWVYYLQAGAFRGQAEAENARAKLALLGMEAHITEKQSDTGALYRVRLGPFNKLDVTNQVRGKLAENSVDAALVRVPK